MADILITKATPAEKLGWAFKVYVSIDHDSISSTDSRNLCRYDIDNSDSLDKAEMMSVLKSLYCMVGEEGVNTKVGWCVKLDKHN